MSGTARGHTFPPLSQPSYGGLTSGILATLMEPGKGLGEEGLGPILPPGNMAHRRKADPHWMSYY